MSFDERQADKVNAEKIAPLMARLPNEEQQRLFALYRKSEAFLILEEMTKL